MIRRKSHAGTKMPETACFVPSRDSMRQNEPGNYPPDKRKKRLRGRTSGKKFFIFGMNGYIVVKTTK